LYSSATAEIVPKGSNPQVQVKSSVMFVTLNQSKRTSHGVMFQLNQRKSNLGLPVKELKHNVGRGDSRFIVPMGFIHPVQNG